MNRMGMIVVCAAALAGCVTSVDREYEPSRAVIVPCTEKSIAYSFRRATHAATSVEFDRSDKDGALLGGWAAPQEETVALAQFRDAFRRDAKTIVPTGDGNRGSCDIMMDVMQQNSFNSLAPVASFFSGLTFTIIPCWGDDMYTLYVEVSDGSGRKKTYQVSRSVSTVTWLPFIFGLPFTGTPNTRVDEITLYNWQELRDRMAADGFFR